MSNSIGVPQDIKKITTQIKERIFKTKQAKQNLRLTYIANWYFEYWKILTEEKSHFLDITLSKEHRSKTAK